MLDELEKRLLANRDDRDSWLVYADALQTLGDPRGEVIALGEQIRAGASDAVRTRYAERCRAARWPREKPFPHMHYAVRFAEMFKELRARPEITVFVASVTPPDPAQVEKWRRVAGPSWPDAMGDLYSEISSVDLQYAVAASPSDPGANAAGMIRIRPLAEVWDELALEGDLWSASERDDHPFRSLRPIDRFIPEACSVLYLEPKGREAQVAYHSFGEELFPTGLHYREWLELLFRSRGVLHWLKLTVGPRSGQSWVEDGIDLVAKLFPDFDPSSMSPATPRESIDVSSAD